MTLHSTARQANYLDSLKKYFVDNLETAQSIPVTFDKALNIPDLQDRTVDRWVNVVFGTLAVDDLGEMIINIFCCTRRDNEYYRLVQLRDKVLELLTIDADVDSDGMKRITLYKSYPPPWTEIGKLLVIDVRESGHFEAEDETKYKIITVKLLTVVKG